jgi:chromosome segregation ATPase
MAKQEKRNRRGAGKSPGLIACLIIGALALVLCAPPAYAGSKSGDSGDYYDDLMKGFNAFWSKFQDHSDKYILEQLKEFSEKVETLEKFVEKVGFEPSRKNCGLRQVNERKEDILKLTDMALRNLDAGAKFQEEVLEGKTIGGRPITREDVMEKVEPVKEALEKIGPPIICLQGDIKNHRENLKELQKEVKEHDDLMKEAEEYYKSMKKTLEEKKKTAEEKKKKFEDLKKDKGPSHKSTIEAQNKYHEALGDINKWEKQMEKHEEKLKRMKESHKKLLEEVKKETGSPEPPEKQLEAWKEE